MMARRAFTVLLLLGCALSLFVGLGCRSVLAEGSYARIAHLRLENLAEGPRREIRAAIDSSTDPVARSTALWKAAEDFERRNDFAAAFVAYQEIARTGALPVENLRRRMRLCRARLAVDARWNDDELRSAAREMDTARGLGLYREVVRTLHDNYVDPVSYAALLEGGLDNLRAAMASPAFCRLFGIEQQSDSHTAFLAAVESVAKQMADEAEPNNHTLRYYVRRLCQENRRSLAIPNGVIIAEFLFGAAEHLDGYTAYLTHAMYEDFLDDLRGKFVGLGIELTDEEDRLRVTEVFAGGPAEKAGMLRGDVLLAVNGTDVSAMKLNQVVGLLRGARGTGVSVTVRRQEQEKTFTVVRQAIVAPSVRHAVRMGPEGRIGYIRLAGFQRGTGHEVDRAVSRLASDGPLDGLVLDLRNNPGGLLEAAVDVAGLFLKEGVVLKTEGRAFGQSRTHKVSPWRLSRHDQPLVLLINGSTASAGEIVAAALKDHGRATLVGGRTYGKGVVQSILPVECGQSAVCVTTARFCGPDGESFHGVGIAPDVAVQGPPGRMARNGSPDPEQDAVLSRAIDLLTRPSPQTAAARAEPALEAAR